MAEFQTMKTNLETLEEQKEKWDDKLTEFDTMKTNLETLEKEKENLKTEAQTMTTSITTLTEEATKQQEEQEKLKTDLKTEREAREKQEKDLQEGRMEALQRTVVVLKGQLSDKETVYNKAKDKVSDLRRKIEDEEKYLEDFTVEREKSTKIIVTLGMTGSGKSTLCNRLDGDESMEGNEGGAITSDDSESCTQHYSKYHVQIGDHRVTVIDTPGIGDSNGRERDRRHCNGLCKFMKGCGGINAFVLVRNGLNARFDQTIQDMLRQYHDMFGDKFFERLIIVATRIEGFAKKLYEKRDREKTMRKDICKLFGRDELNISVIPIGFEDYKDSIQALVEAVPEDKHDFEEVKSPIDQLKLDHSAAEKERDSIGAEVISIKKELEEMGKKLKEIEKELSELEEKLKKRNDEEPSPPQ